MEISFEIYAGMSDSLASNAIDLSAILKKSLDRALFLIYFYTRGSIEWC